MAYELVAARLLAPAIGSSTYVWTSVIGVIIAALACGFYIGGKVADARKRPEDIAWLCLFIAGAITWTLLSYQSVLQGVAMSDLDARLQGVVAALFLFAPTSLMIGILNPYLIKLNVRSLEHSGRSVASLDALNAIGGIVGTFITGFILFGAVGSRESLLILVITMIVASWLMVPRVLMAARVITSTMCALLAVTTVATPLAGAIDTPTAHYEIVEGMKNDRLVRVIVTGPEAAQSGIYVGAPSDLLFWYSKQVDRVIADSPNKERILILGGGAFTLPQYLADKYPASQIDVVEIDPELSAIATEHFGYKSPSNVKVIAGDARHYANQTKSSYDIVLVDVYNDASVPFSLLTREYGRAASSLLAPDGIIIVNAIAAFGGDCLPLFEAINSTYASSLPYGYALKSPDAPDDRSNILLVYSRKEQSIPLFTPIVLPVAPYSDNYMPAEQLSYDCKRA